MTSKEVCVVEFEGGGYGIKIIRTKKSWLFGTSIKISFISRMYYEWVKPDDINNYCIYSSKEDAYKHMNKYLLTHKELE